MNFNKKIAEIRKFLNLSNAGLEKKLSLSNGYISNIEKNGTDNPGKLLIALSEIGISTDWFLTGKGEMLTKKVDKSTADSAEEARLEVDKSTPSAMATSSFLTEQELHSNKATNSPTKNVVSNSIESLALESTAPRFAELEEKISTQNEKLNNLQAQIDELKGAVEKKLPEEADDKRYRYTPDPKLRPYSDLHVAEPQSSYGLKKESSEPEETEDLPLAENLAAGIPIEAFDSGETYPVPKKFLKRGKKYCVAKIKGTSMTEAGIVDGSFVLLEYTDTALSGEIMVVKYGEQTTLKRLSQKEDGAWELLYEDGSSAVIPLKDGDWEVKGHYVRVVN